MESSAQRPQQSSPGSPDAVSVPVRLLTDSRLSHPAARLYGVLATFPDGDPPTIRQLRAALGASERAVQRWLIQLEQAGWITREERWAAPWGLIVHREPVSADPPARKLHDDPRTFTIGGSDRVPR